MRLQAVQQQRRRCISRPVATTVLLELLACLEIVAPEPTIPACATTQGNGETSCLLARERYNILHFISACPYTGGTLQYVGPVASAPRRWPRRSALPSRRSSFPVACAGDASRQYHWMDGRARGGWQAVDGVSTDRHECTYHAVAYDG